MRGLPLSYAEPLVSTSELEQRMKGTWHLHRHLSLVINIIYRQSQTLYIHYISLYTYSEKGSTC